MARRVMRILVALCFDIDARLRQPHWTKRRRQDPDRQHHRLIKPMVVLATCCWRLRGTALYIAPRPRSDEIAWTPGADCGKLAA